MKNESTKSLKAMRKQFQSQGVFYTPSVLAEEMKTIAYEYVSAPRNVYDPTCGTGSLLAVFPDEVKKYGQELDPDELEKCQERLANFEGVCGDTLTEPAFPDKRFDIITANYPFSVKWEPKTDVRFENAPALPPAGKADYAFILHCLYCLADEGVAVVMAFPGILYRGNAEGKIRKWLVSQNYVEKVIQFPGKYFEDTTVPVCILVLRKNKNSTDIIFQDKEKDLERTVSLDEVASNGYNLSVSSYVQEEKEIEVVDPIALEQECRDAALRHLKASIEASLMITMMDEDVAKALPLSNYLDNIEELVKKYREDSEALI